MIVVVVVGMGAGAVLGGHYLHKGRNASNALAAGQVAYERGDWPTAVVRLREYLSDNHDDVAILQRYATARMRIRPFDPQNVAAAIGAYRSLLQIDPSDSKVYRSLARLYSWVGDYGNLSYIATRRLASDSDDPDAAVWLGRAQMLMRNTDQARQTLETFLARCEQSGRMGRRYVEACALLGAMAADRASEAGVDDAEAMQWANRAVEHCPESALAWVVRAETRRRGADRDGVDRPAMLQEAIADLRTADSLAIDDPRTRLMLCDEWLAHDRLLRAADQLHAAATFTPADIAERFISFDEWEVAAFSRSGELAMRQRQYDRGAAEAEAILDRVANRSLRAAVFPLAIRLCAAAGRSRQADDYLQEHLAAGAADTVDVTEAERIALLQTAVLWAEDRPYRIIGVLEPVVANNSANPAPLQLLSQAYSRTGQTRRAIDMLGRYLQLRPDDGVMWMQLARLHVRAGQWVQADRAAHADPMDPADIEVRLLQVETEIRAAAALAPAEHAKRLGALVAELAELARTHPDRLDTVLLQAEVAYACGDTQVAEQLLTGAATGENDSMAAQLKLASLFRRTGGLDRAIAAAGQACRHYGHRAEPWVLTSDLLVEAGRPAEAIERLTEAGECVIGAAQRADVAIRLATVRILHGDRAAGVAGLGAMAAAHPDNIASRAVLLGLPEIRSDTTAAQMLIDDIRRIQGDSGLLWRIHQARLWMDSSQWRSRQQDIRELLAAPMAADPRWSEPALLLGRMHQRLGDLPAAEALYRRLLAADPGAMDVVDRLSGLLQQQRRYAEAQRLLAGTDAGVAALSSRRARLALITGDLSAAIDQLKLKIAADGDDVTARVLLARTLYGQTHNAAQAFGHLDMAEAAAGDSMMVTAARVAILTSEGQFAEAKRLLDEQIARTGSFEAYLMRAAFRSSMGEPEAAEADYNHLAGLAADGRGYEVLAAFHWDRNRPDEAFATLEKGLGAHPEDASLMRRMVAALLDRGDAESRRRAAAVLDKLEAADPDDTKVMVLRAQCLAGARTGEALDQARRLLTRAVEIQPAEIEAHRMLIEIASGRMDYRRARDLAAGALGPNPGDVGLLMARAAAEYHLRNLDNAGNLAEEVLRAAPGHADALAMLVDIAIRRRDAKATEQVERRITEAVARAPANGRLHAAMARLLSSSDRFAEAIAALETFCRTPTGSDRAEVMVTLSQLYEKQGDTASAGRWMDRAADTSRDSDIVQSRMRWLARRRRYGEIASVAITYADGRAPDPAVMCVAASLLAESAEPDHVTVAARLYETVILTYPDYVRAHHGMAVVAHRAGDAELAVKILNDALRISPDHVGLLNDLAWILQESDRNVDVALELADRGLFLDPDNDHLRDTRGEILIRMGRLEDAYRDLTACLQLRPEAEPPRGRTLLKLGKLCARRGETDESKRYLVEAIRIDRRHDVFGASERDEISRMIE